MTVLMEQRHRRRNISDEERKDRSTVQQTPTLRIVAEKEGKTKE